MSNLSKDILRISAAGFSLNDTLHAGQTFCWRKISHQTWLGSIFEKPCIISQTNTGVEIQTPYHEEKEIRSYFHLNEEWNDIIKELAAKDLFLKEALEMFPGLQCVLEPWWECTANFICSSLKQITQIEQINKNLRQYFKKETAIENFYSFPKPEEISLGTEGQLRECALGFRAKHLFKTAQQITNKEWLWEETHRLNIEEAVVKMKQLHGIGDKVAHCILLYAGERWDAFPIDVWIERMLVELYFKNSKKKINKEALNSFSLKRFGSYRGIAQLYLFHWYRMKQKSNSRN
jgi:N-glycosylase/DNA lyase